MHLKTLAVSLCLACLAFSGLAPELGAQTRQSGAAVPLVAGTRVRVKAPNLVAPLVANFLEQRGDTLVFIEDGRGRGVWSFDIAQIERLEMTAGQADRNRQPIARGAAFGAAIGLVAGVLFASVADPSDSTRKYSTVLTGALGAGAGAGVGALVGSRVKSERWVTVPLTRQFSFRSNGRGAFGFSIGIR